MSQGLFRRAPVSPLVMLAAAMLAVGCGLYTDIKDATRDTSLWSEASTGTGSLKMRIVVAPLQNRTRFAPEGHPSTFSRSFAALLEKECPRVRLTAPGDPDFPETLSRLPETGPGLTDNQAVAEVGRRMGFNAVVTATVFDISGKTERRGVLWFRDSKSFVQFTVGAAVFDMETGAKILDETYEDEIEIDPFDLDALEKGQRIENPELEEALAEAAEKLAEAACDRIGKLPWKGFLLSATAPIQVAAGRNVGIEVGDRFDVYATGRAMEGLEGQRFFLPGKKVAQVEVVSVTDDRATAEVVSGEGPLAPGYTVRPAR